MTGPFVIEDAYQSARDLAVSGSSSRVVARGLVMNGLFSDRVNVQFARSFQRARMGYLGAFVPNNLGEQTCS